MRLRNNILSILALIALFPGVAQADDLQLLQQQLLLLIQQVTQLQSNLNTIQRVSNLPCSTLTKNLGLNDSGDEVAFLQTALEREGFDVGDEKYKHVYGELTASGVTGFQQKYKDEILTPVGLQYGTGFAGKGTRTKLNSIYGCGAKAPDLSGRPVVVTPQAIHVTSPVSGQTLATSTKIMGAIDSDGWITPSGDLGTVTLFDTAGRQLSQVGLTTKADKKVLPVSFEATLNTVTPRTDFGVLVFTSRSTSSILSLSAKEFRLPVKFGNPVKGVMQVLFPQPNQQLSGGGTYTFTWSGGSSAKVSLLLLSNSLELYGGKAVAWQKDNLPNNGSYLVTLPPLQPGTYRLYVTDGTRFGLSSFFYINQNSTAGGQIPRFTGIQGPQSLQIRETGTWTVAGTDLDSGNLGFSVDWGDGTSGRPAVLGTGGTASGVFTHSYAVNGTYTQIFRITDPSGLTDQRANTVQVGSATAPTITSITPSSGPQGTVVTITGTRFNTTNNTVTFGTGQLTGIPSKDGKTLQFTVQQDQVGGYDISVLSGSGRTNTVTFTVAPPPTCNYQSTGGTNQLLGCFWKWRGDSIPSSPDDGILSGEAIPTPPGYLPPVPGTATALDINWGDTIPANSFTGVDNYSARWLGSFTFDPGTYRFIGGSDDGIRVFINGNLQLDKWIIRPYAEDTFEITFPVQTTVNLRVDYMERGVFARVKFGWTKL